jgi:hypothetical protein
MELNLGTEKLYLHGTSAELKNIASGERLAKFQQAVKEYIRPPLEQVDTGNTLLLLDRAKKVRGNSAIFRCAFADCGHVADADIQAAINIAIKCLLKRHTVNQYHCDYQASRINPANYL